MGINIKLFSGLGFCAILIYLGLRYNSSFSFHLIIGGFIIWFFWIEAEPLGLWLIELLTSGMSADSALKAHLLESAAHTRLMTMGLIMMLVLRFAPKGLIPEAKR